MKSLFKKSIIVILLFGTAIYFTSCKKEATATLPVVATTNVSDITETTALARGTVTEVGGAVVTDIGVCWSTFRNPTISSNKISIGTGAGSFTGSLTGLTADTRYYVRAYATNSLGTAYGLEISFSTQDFPPAPVTTSAIVSFSSTAAVVTGNVIYGQNGNHLIVSGVCWSTSQNPTTTDSKTMNDTYSGIFTSNLIGLTQGTTYYVRAYALYDNSPAIYGNELSFTTSYDQGTGTQKADFPGGKRAGARGFSIGTKVYMGLGSDGENWVRDFWEWDQASNVWSRKADYPGNSAGGEVAFSIGTKGYIGAGTGNEFWEYDPAINTWTQKSSVPGTYGLAGAVGFSIGTKGYIGTGYLNDGTPILGDNSFSQDFWEWDQATNIWMKKAGFPGNERSNAVGFSIGNNGYIGTGSGSNGNFGLPLQDFWEYDPTLK